MLQRNNNTIKYGSSIHRLSLYPVLNAGLFNPFSPLNLTSKQVK